MKYIILFLFSYTLQADVWIQRSPVTEQTGTGYTFMFQDSGIMRCWSMPDVLDITYIPLTWMKVTDAAVTYSWPFAEGELATACQNSPQVYRTMGGPLFGITAQLQVATFGTVPAGVPCGDQSGQFTFLRAVTHGGVSGTAVCSLM